MEEVFLSKREETLAKNTVAFAIGNFASKLLQIVLVPFYTRVLTKGEYGTVDILQAAVALLIPIFALAIYESVFRFSMEKEQDKSAVLTVGLVITVLGVVAMCLIGFALAFFVSPLYVWLVIANTAANALWTSLSQYTKAIGRTALFTVNSVLTTFLVLVLNVVFLVPLQLGITGYMLGYTLANFLSGLMLILCLKKDFKIDFKKINAPLVRQMLIYALPLLLNGICWWLSSFTDRIMIFTMLGDEENGLYAAASKIPHILAVLVTIFYQAWQISANLEYDAEDASGFYSKTNEQNIAFTLLAASAMIVLCRPISTVFLGAEYSSAWVFIPTLVLSTAFFSFAQFLISIYTAHKKTKMAFITNIIGTVINVVLNAVLIPIMGALGAAIATTVSYFVLWLVRVFDTQRLVKISYKIPRLIISSIIIVAQAILITLDLDYVITYTVSSIGLLLVAILYRDVVISLFRFCIGFIKKIFVKEKK